jgi:DNA-directed RNA polymerase subunit RPC12/RpoP
MLLAILCGGLILILNLARSVARLSFGLDMLAAFITFTGLAFGCLGIRCPQCHLRVLWHLATTGNPRALTRLAFLNACPRCGFDGAAMPLT